MTPSKKIGYLTISTSLLCSFYLSEIIPAPFNQNQQALRGAVDKGIALLLILCMIIAFGALQWDFQVARKKKLLEQQQK